MVRLIVNGAPILDPLRRFVRNQQLILIVLAVFAGTAAAFGAVLFREIISLFQAGTYGESLENMSDIIKDLPDWHIIIVPTLGGLLIGLFVHYCMPGRRGRGVCVMFVGPRTYSGGQARCRVPR